MCIDKVSGRMLRDVTEYCEWRSAVDLRSDEGYMTKMV